MVERLAVGDDAFDPHRPMLKQMLKIFLIVTL